jgi:hypothetical protein
MLSKLILSSILVLPLFSNDRVVHNFPIDSLEDNKSINVFNKIGGRLFRQSSLYSGDNALASIKMGFIKYLFVDRNYTVPSGFASIVDSGIKIIGTTNNIKTLAKQIGNTNINYY